MYFLSVNKGCFELTLNRKVVKKTKSPDELFLYLREHDIGTFNTSSSVDFPEEYGMPRAMAQRLWDLIEAFVRDQQRLTERALTPLIYKVQTAACRRGEDAYAQEKPCRNAYWHEDDQWWKVQLSSLLDLQDLQKERGSAVSLQNGVLTIEE